MTNPLFTPNRRLVLGGSIASALAFMRPAGAQLGEPAANPATISRVMQIVSEYIAHAAGGCDGGLFGIF